MESILESEPAALFVDVVYSSESAPAYDAALISALTTPVVTALPIIIDTVALNQPLVEVLPFNGLLSVVDVLGHVHVELDDDSIARSTYLYQGIGDAHWPHLTVALAHQLGWAPKQPPCPRTFEFTLQNQRCDHVMVPFSGPPGTILEVSALDVLEGRTPPTLFNDKAVFVGLTASGVADSVTSPVSGESRPMSGVEYNANLFNGVLANRLVRPAAPWLIWVLTLGFVAIPLMLLPRTNPKSMLAVSVVGALLPLVCTALTMIFASRYLPLGTACITALLAYPLWSWRRHEAAWRYLDTEMMRLQLERERYAPVEAALVASRHPEPSRLAKLFGAEHEQEAVLSDAPLTRLITGPKLIAFSDHKGTRHRFRRAEAFSEAEQLLAEQLLVGDRHPESDASLLTEPVPGESLAAKIRLLRSQALAVQLGRDIGLQGLERMASGVCVVSAVGDLLFVNTAVRRYLGDSLDAGDNIFTVVQDIPLPLGQSWTDIWRAVVCGQETLRFETPLDADTQVFIYCAPLTGDAQGAWLLTITDTTQVRVEQRRREEALAFLSHDLRSPLVSVIALARKSFADGKEAHELLGEIEGYAQKSLAVSEQFLQLSRLEAQSKFETYELDVLAVLSNAVDQSFAVAKSRAIAVDANALLGFEDGVWVNGNGELLERAFGDLISNAVKYSDSGSEVVVKVALLPGFVELSVVDQGLGIPEHDIAQLFEPYYRSTEPLLAERRGSGLGLRFVKTVIDRHKGEIQVQSAIGVGSTFVVKLPRLEFELED